VIDVLLPVLNAEATIQTAIRSTLRALSRNDRVLVLDDGSSDRTAEILGRMKRQDPRVEIISNLSPQGVANGLNVLLEASRAPLVARMDADDICLPWRFTVQERELRKTEGIVFSSYLKFARSHLTFKQPLPIRLTSEACREILRVENPLCHPTLLARRETLINLGGYECGMAEDYLTWLKAIDAGIQVIRSPLPVLLYRVSHTQVSGGHAWRRDAFRQIEESEHWKSLYQHNSSSLERLRPLEKRAAKRALTRAPAVAIPE